MAAINNGSFLETLGGQYSGGNPNPNSFNNPSGISGSSALQSLLGSMPQFQPITGGITSPSSQSLYTPSSPYQQDAYQAKDMSSADLPQYDAMRTRLNSQYSQQQSQSQDSLDRQFAAMGGGPGNGAQAKQTENLSAGIAQQKGQDLLNVNAQEAQTRTGLQQQQDQMAFQSGESQKGYAFQAGQADIGRQFQAGVTGAQMGQQAQEFNAQQGTQSQQFNAEMQQSQNQFNFGAQSSIAQMGMQQQQYNSDQWTTAFNAAMEAKKNGDGSPINQLMQNYLNQGINSGYLKGT